MDENVQIIDGTDSSDSDNAPPANLNFELAQVDVFISQEDGQPLHMMQEEINENELLGGNPIHDMQLSFVELIEPPQEPVFA